METFSDFKNEVTLAGVAQNPEMNLHYLLFAVVIDVSEPMKLEDSSNYITRLKVIDPSFNYRQELRFSKLKFHKFVHINIFTERPEEAPKIQYVGDIIRLRRFKFKFTPKGELMGNDVKYSNWLVYPGRKEEPLVSASYKKYSKNVNRGLTKLEEERIRSLQDWNEEFLFKNSMKYVIWWSDWKHPSDDQGTISKAHVNVDLVLQCTAVDATKKNKVSFADRDGFTFELLLNEKPSLKVGQVIKLRCVELAALKDKQTTRQIKLTPLSSCLLLPKFSCDARHFNKDAQKKAGGEKAGKELPFLNDYELPDEEKPIQKKKGAKASGEKCITAVKKGVSGKKSVSISELLEMQKNFAKNQGQKFILNGYIAGFIDTDPQKVIKRLQADKKVVDFKSGTKDKKEKGSKIIYHLVLQVKDASVEKSDKFLDVYVLTGEHESHLFGSWNLLPAIDDFESWNSIKQSKLADFEKKLNSLKNPEYKVKLAVELMVTKQGKPFYKLVDTVFLPL